MPKLTKKEKQEWDFFIDPKTGRRTYNKLCSRCIHDCKQSYKADILSCPHYQSKRGKQSKAKKSE